MGKGLTIFFYLLLIISIIISIIKIYYKIIYLIKNKIIIPILKIIKELYILIKKYFLKYIVKFIFFKKFFKKFNSLELNFKNLDYDYKYYLFILFLPYEKIKIFLKNYKIFFKFGNKKSFYYLFIIKKNKKYLNWYFK